MAEAPPWLKGDKNETVRAVSSTEVCWQLSVRN